MIVAAAGCGRNDKKTTEAVTTAAQSTEAETTAAQSTEAPAATEAPATEAPTTEAATEVPTTEAPTEPASTEAPELEAIDYSLPENWAYYDLGDNKPVDLFLICPTVDTRSERNALDLNDKLKERFIYALDLERGIFEESARMYSPYYRQMSIKAYTLPEEERKEALRLAYEDVAAAFRWYLEHENGGRGLILAGFSQGAELCLELMKEFCGGDTMEAAMLRGNLVSVYAIGWYLTEETTLEFPQIVPAVGEKDTGHVVMFECEDGTLSGSVIIPEGVKTLSINPLNWMTDSTPADKSLNLGAVMNGAEAVPGLCGCHIGERGELVVTDVTPAEYPPGLDILPEGSYHLYDYMFFFENLRENVAERTARWLGACRG